jgi:predicted RNase H-like nuclease
MTVTIGVDGFRHGWVVVELGPYRRLDFVRNINEVLARAADRIAIDMPIGLPSHGDRACDHAARGLLRPHAARVFTAPRRRPTGC